MEDSGRLVVANISALLALLPAAFLAFRSNPSRDAMFWWLSLVAFVGPLVWCVFLTAGAWQTGLSVALWVTVTASMLLFLVLSWRIENIWRLSPLLLPYLILVGIVATVWGQVPSARTMPEALSTWTSIHIILSVLTYGLITLAAMAGAAAFLQERALKSKQPTRLTDRLPAVAVSERLQLQLLVASEIVLGLGLLTGFAVQMLDGAESTIINHKTLLTIGAFIVIGILLIAHMRTGVRGRRVSRMALLAYLLVTLGYPGVKFVTDVLLA